MLRCLPGVGGGHAPWFQVCSFTAQSSVTEAAAAFAPNMAASETSLALKTSCLLRLAGQRVSKKLLTTLFRVSGSRAVPGLYSIERGYGDGRHGGIFSCRGIRKGRWSDRNQGISPNMMDEIPAINRRWPRCQTLSSARVSARKTIPRVRNKASDAVAPDFSLRVSGRDTPSVVGRVIPFTVARGSTTFEGESCVR